MIPSLKQKKNDTGPWKGQGETQKDGETLNLPTIFWGVEESSCFFQAAGNFGGLKMIGLGGGNSNIFYFQPYLGR